MTWASDMQGGARMSPLHRVQIEAGAQHVHDLGPRALAELLLELAPADQVLDRLNRYRRFSPALLRAIGANRFPPRLYAVPDDRRRA